MVVCEIEFACFIYSYESHRSKNTRSQYHFLGLVFPSSFSAALWSMWFFSMSCRSSFLRARRSTSSVCTRDLPACYMCRMRRYVGMYVYTCMHTHIHTYRIHLKSAKHEHTSTKNERLGRSGTHVSKALDVCRYALCVINGVSAWQMDDT